MKKGISPIKHLVVFLLLGTKLFATCNIPNWLPRYVNVSTSTYLDSDISRNISQMHNLCKYNISFVENRYKWKMSLILHPNKKGPFWFLPHDNENTAFDAAVYAVLTYGGGFLAVEANEKRYFLRQDPNRNFGDTKEVSKRCSKQLFPAPRYTHTIFSIIDTYKPKNLPYMALHNNSDGWNGNGGRGTISILKSSRSVQSYQPNNSSSVDSLGLRDEDSLIYIAGTQKHPNISKLNKFLNLGLNTKYEVVRKNNNDCSMSNYVVLTKKTDRYVNIEAEHGDYNTQRIMIDKIMSLYGYDKKGSENYSRIQQESLPIALEKRKSKVKNYNGLYVCYDKKYATNKDNKTYVKYVGCDRYSQRCGTIHKKHFGKYPNGYQAQKAFERCLNSSPKFID